MLALAHKSVVFKLRPFLHVGICRTEVLVSVTRGRTHIAQLYVKLPTVQVSDLASQPALKLEEVCISETLALPRRQHGDTSQENNVVVGPTILLFCGHFTSLVTRPLYHKDF